jgi:hypothetical protein
MHRGGNPGGPLPFQEGLGIPLRLIRSALTNKEDGELERTRVSDLDSLTNGPFAASWKQNDLEHLLTKLVHNPCVRRVS